MPKFLSANARSPIAASISCGDRGRRAFRAGGRLGDSAAATAAMRTKLGWSGDSEAPEIEYRRATVLSRLVPVARQVCASVAPAGDAPAPDVAGAMANFEAWYRETYPQPFWALFEQYMPDTPRTDF